ncbi:NAD-dependent epimerase/dehydratase [Euzebya pacifica]|uniref:NAD-dependent epimerase/dehydratase n=1 Tax=Euzebya pacifica TaxID=1608957 RepID=A0A346Y1P4_9ACTN|nr:NAD(P)H-binding protein [Euzebya pacifica]AXV08391.1 NAD-dependent epimerase/dehydratase [Euzebya pacifica]
MPVMVVGVENVVGRRAVELLVPRGGEVRVFVQAAAPDGGGEERLADPDTFRAMGCKVAHGFLDDEAHLETALEQVHTVLLLAGRPTDDPDVHLDRVATVISAAIGAGCRRLVLLSDLAASEPGDNAWLEALAEAESLAADAPMESVVLRSALLYGHDDPLTVALAAGAAGEGAPGAHWPIAADDVAMAAVLADAERELDTSLHVVVDVAGPVRVTTAELVGALADVVPAADGEPLPPAALDLVHRVVERPDNALGVSGAMLEDFSAPIR